MSKSPLLVTLVLFFSISPVAVGQDADSPFESNLRQTEKKADKLRQRLQQCRNDGQDIVIPDASLAVAELFIQFAKQDHKDDREPKATKRSIDYINLMLDERLTESDAALSGTQPYAKVPDWNVVGVKSRDGGFWSGDDQVFLTGFNWNASMARDNPQMMKRLGVNLVDGMLRGSMDASGNFSNTSYVNRDGPYLEQMAHENFAVDCMLSLNPPDWLFERHPDLRSPGYGHYVGYAIDHPALLEYRRKCLDHLLPLYKKHKSLFAVDLFNEPAFQGTSSYTFIHWRKWLQTKYSSIEKLNSAWDTEFTDFQAIHRFPTQPKQRKHEWQRADVQWDEPGARGTHYDWCAFNKHRVTDYFQLTNDRIREHAPDVSTHVKSMLANYFTGSTEQRGWQMKISYNTFGVDVPAISEMCSLLGGDDSFRDLSSVEAPNRYFGNSSYVAGWLNSGLATDLMKSIAPDKPFYNSEFHAVEHVDAVQIDQSPGEHVKLALWHTHLHGMSANLLWYWGRSVDGSVGKQGQRWFAGSLLDQPWLLNSYTRESLNLRRFVPQVSAFSRQPRMVRLLYSENSAIQDVKAIDTLRDAYEALNFLGASVGFVTERQLASGTIGDHTKLIIVPNVTYASDEVVQRLQQAATDGVTIGIIGRDCLRKNPVGHTREVLEIANAKNRDVGSPQEYHQVFDRWLHAAEVPRELIASDADGKPAWGVEVRSARHGEQRLGYLINLLREPTTVQIKWLTKDASFGDLQTGKPIGSQLTLQPRQVVLGEYSSGSATLSE